MNNTESCPIPKSQSNNTRHNYTSAQPARWIKITIPKLVKYKHFMFDFVIFLVTQTVQSFKVATQLKAGMARLVFVGSLCPTTTSTSSNIRRLLKQTTSERKT